MFCPACQRAQYKKQWNAEQWDVSDPTGKWLSRCKQCDPGRVGRTRDEAELCLQTLQRCVDFMNQNLNVRNGVKRFVDCWLALPQAMRKIYSYHGKLRRSSSHPMDDAGNAVYLIFWRLFLPEVLPRYHLADLETIGDLWESIFGYAYLKGIHPQQGLDLPCGQLAPDMLRFMLLMTWCIRAVRGFLPTAAMIKHGEYHTVMDLRRDVQTHFRQCALPAPGPTLNKTTWLGPDFL